MDVDSILSGVREHFNSLGRPFDRLRTINAPCAAGRIDFSVQIVESGFQPIAHVGQLAFIEGKIWPSLVFAVIGTIFKQGIILVLNQLHDMLLGQDGVAQGIVAGLRRSYKTVVRAVMNQAVIETIAHQAVGVVGGFAIGVQAPHGIQVPR